MGVTAVTKDGSPNTSASPVRTLGDGLDARRLLGCLGGVDRDGGEVVLRRDRVVGDEDLVDGVGERGADPLPEHRDERDEREPDHERGRGRGGSLRVPLGVPARELPGSAADLGRRPAEDSRQRRDELRREEGDAEEDEQRAEAHEEQDLRRSEAAAEEAEDQRGKAERRAIRIAPERAEAREPGRGQRRSLAHRGDRRHARRADAGGGSQEG